MTDPHSAAHSGPVDELLTLRDLIRWGASRFNEAGLTFGHGTDNPLDEAALLALHALFLDHSLPPHYLDARLTRDERSTVVELLQRRLETRKPAAYITGIAHFAGLSFIVNESVLVPRSPIGELIQQGFAPWIEADRVERILDIGTGSGCIAIACAYHFPEAMVDAADVSEGALKVTQANIERHGMHYQVEPVLSDVFSNLNGRQYDIIVSNPPYVDENEMSTLAPEFRWEPIIGLASGEDGLDVTRRILQDAARHLKPGGILVVEVGNSAPALEDAYPQVPFTWLEFEHGGHGVFLLTAEQLEEYQELF